MKPIPKLCSRALFTIVGGSVLINPAFAQEQAGEEIDEVVVTGFRAALGTAQTIKRDANTFVDSITATDIGSFPDKSVAEALQRIPGITVSRLQSADDSTHFSAEPSSVLIRGLTFVRTEFNGRDSFSADVNRGLNFNDISPELMAGIDAYKNQTAEMIEGGIAGTVNLRTRLPLDAEGQQIALTGRANYGDRSEEATYEASGIYSNVWEAGDGRFGLMLNAAYSHLLTRTEGVVAQRIATYCNSGFGTATAGIVNSDGSIPCTVNPAGGQGWLFAPRQVNYTQTDYDRTRKGASIALQYESSEKDFLVTLQGIDSRYDNPWKERSPNISWPAGVGFGSPTWNPKTPEYSPLAGTPAFSYGADGMLDSGVFAQNIFQTGFNSRFGTTPTNGNINQGSAVPGLPFVNDCPDSDGVPGNGVQCVAQTGVSVSNEARNFGHTEGTRDISVNVKWDINERVHTNFDVQSIRAKTNNYDILVAANTLATAAYSTNGDGTPTIVLTPAPNVNYAPGFLANPHNYFMQFIQDHWEDNEADEFAVRADAEFDIGDGGGWLNSLKVGVRHADRSQKVRYSNFGWSQVASPGACNGPGFNVDNTTPAPYPTFTDCPTGTFQGYGEGIWESQSLGDFFDGGVFPNGDLVFLNRAALGDREAHIEALSDRTTNSPLGWTPRCERAGLAEGCFTSDEILDVSERSKAVYLMLNFGGDETKIFGDVSVSGNVGVRYVKTDVTSAGNVNFPAPTWYTNLVATADPCDASNNNPATTVTDIRCWLTPDLLAFSNPTGANTDIYKSSYNDILPSFNVRFGVTDKQFVRFGYSRGLSRPDFGQMRNFVQIGAPPIDVSPTSPYVIRDSAGTVTGYNFIFNAEAGFAGVEPTTADSFDVSYENYLSNSSSLTFGVFYKKLDTTIGYGRSVRTITNNGSTQDVTIRGPSNQDSDGVLKGFEVAYQTFFDFLPGAWSGLGAQLNYTRTKQTDINNSNLANTSAYIPGGTTAFGGGNNISTGGAGNGSTNGNGPGGNPLSFAGNTIDSHRLAGISDHSYNIVGLYERGWISARLAWSWRSEFVTANLDCCIGLPIWQKEGGYLDGSVRFQLNDNLELSLDGSNLLDQTAEYQQQVFGDSTATPGAAPVKVDSAWIKNDRRLQLGIRWKL